MCGGLFTGLSREFAVRFAFLMSIPAVLGAAVFKLPDMLDEGIAAANALPYAAGFLSSAICGYLAIRIVKALMKKGSFKFFAVYCAAVGLITVVLNLI
jgi:undecaprenyl-diphosphatase